jgi:hypothetical protein
MTGTVGFLRFVTWLLPRFVARYAYPFFLWTTFIKMPRFTFIVGQDASKDVFIVIAFNRRLRRSMIFGLDALVFCLSTTKYSQVIQQCSLALRIGLPVVLTTVVLFRHADYSVCFMLLAQVFDNTRLYR